jgi:ribosomal protein S19E (S16A)
VNVELDVLGSSMMNGVLGHVYGGEVITVDGRRLVDAVMKLVEEMSEP